MGHRLTLREFDPYSQWYYCITSDKGVSDALQQCGYENRIQQRGFHYLSDMKPVIRHSLMSTPDPGSSQHEKSRHLELTPSIILTYFGSEQMPLCSNVPRPNLWGLSTPTSLHLAVTKKADRHLHRHPVRADGEINHTHECWWFMETLTVWS